MSSAVNELDLNLLYVLVALDESRSVSGAAVKLGKSQPAVSSALAKLREFFNDPMYVRSGNNMQPTPRALSLVESARFVLGRVGSDIVAAPNFVAGNVDSPPRSFPIGVRIPATTYDMAPLQ